MQSFALILLGCPGMALQSSPDVPLSRSCSVIPHKSCSTARAGGQESCWEWAGSCTDWSSQSGLWDHPRGVGAGTASRRSPEHQVLCSSVPAPPALSQLQHDGSWIQLGPLQCPQTFLASLTVLTLHKEGPFPPLLTRALMQIKATC